MKLASVRHAGLLLALSTLACSTLSIQEETELGTQEQRVVRQQYSMLRDRVIVTYVRELGAELVASARPSPFELRFYVIEDEGLNAFALPGGAIYLHTGLILAVDDVSELSSVLAHELGHVTARHVALQYRRTRTTGLIARIAALAAAIFTRQPELGGLLAQVGASAYLNTFSQEAEREADRLGIETIVKAGYDPHGTIRLLETLQAQAQGVRLPQFLSTHPATPERIRNVRAEIEARKKSGVPIGNRSDDGGKLEMIQERIREIIGTDAPDVPEQPS